MNQKIIANNLQRIRKMRGHTLATLGFHLGVTYQQVQKYESGKNRVSADVLFRAARVLCVDIKELYKGCK